jgi:hypothetical protein
VRDFICGAYTEEKERKEGKGDEERKEEISRKRRGKKI